MENCGEGPLGSRDGIRLSKPSLKVIKGRRNLGENVELKEKLVFWNFTGKLYIRMFSWVGVVSHAFMPVKETKKWRMRERRFNNCDHVRKTGQTGSVLRR